MKIVYVGGMSISAAVLEALCEAGEIPAHVIGYSSELAHRSNYVSMQPLAERYGFALTETKDVNGAEIEALIRSEAPDWLCVFGWSQLVKASILEIPTCGCLGLHMSRLPEGRGRAPVPWTLIKGLSEGAVSYFWLKPAADEGELAAQRCFPVSQSDDAASLVKRVSEISCELMRELIPSMKENCVPRIPQDESRASHWPKRTPKDGWVDWQQSAESIYNLIRGVTEPFPGAFSYLGKEKIMLWRAARLKVDCDQPAGTIVGTYISHGASGVGGMAIAASDGFIVIHELQRENRQRVQGEALLTLAEEWCGQRFSLSTPVTGISNETEKQPITQLG